MIIKYYVFGSLGSFDLLFVLVEPSLNTIMSRDNGPHTFEELDLVKFVFHKALIWRELCKSCMSESHIHDLAGVDMNSTKLPMHVRCAALD